LTLSDFLIIYKSFADAMWAACCACRKVDQEDGTGITDVQLKKTMDVSFPGALPGPAVHERLIEILGGHGFMPENTILGTSICSDEVNTLKGTLVDTMKEHWGTHFPLGGIGGAPYAGKTGFFAFSHHVPENGNVLVFYGPHVGVTANGEIGKCLRHGQSAASTACGACIAAFQQASAGGIDPDMALDMQQSWLREQIAPHVDHIKAAQNPMAALAKVSYASFEQVGIHREHRLRPRIPGACWRNPDQHASWLP
jgi:hypothetical protein